MITKIGTVSLFVSDQQRAKDFYVNKLGFELLSDVEMYPGAATRWVTVVPQGAADGTELNIYAIDDQWAHYQQVVGKSQNMTFMVDDMDATIADLKAKGVTIVNPPKKELWGTYAIIADSEGNHLVLVE